MASKITSHGIKIDPTDASMCQQRVLTGMTPGALALMFGVSQDRIKKTLAKEECVQYMQALVEEKEDRMVDELVPKENPLIATINNPEMFVKLLNHVVNLAMGVTENGGDKIKPRDQISAAKLIMSWSNFNPERLLQQKTEKTLEELKETKKVAADMLATMKEVMSLEKESLDTNPMVKLPGEQKVDNYEIDRTDDVVVEIPEQVKEEMEETQEEPVEYTDNPNPRFRRPK